MTLARRIWKSDILKPIRSYGYGGVQILGEFVCAIPSQHLRRALLKGLFGLRMGPDTVIYRSCRLREPWRIRIGSGTVVGGAVELDGRGGLVLGRNVNISSEVMIWTAQHDHRDPDFATQYRSVSVGDYAWLGPRVIVLPGIVIAEGCVIGAGSVVTQSTEPYGLYAGIPARRIAERNRELRYVPGSSHMPFV